jgi:hypothetical protein
MLHAEDQAVVYHDTLERCCKKWQTDKSQCSWRGRSHEIVEGEVAITSKRSRGQLVPQVGNVSSGDEVEVLEAPRGTFCHWSFICS